MKGSLRFARHDGKVVRLIRQAYRDLSKYTSGSLSRKPNAAERARILALRRQLIDSLEPRCANCAPSDHEWAENASRLRYLALNDDPRRFLRWDVVISSMFVLDAHYVDAEFTYLRLLQDWRSRWRHAIQESRLGQPIPSLVYLKSSDNLIHHAYHIAQFEQASQTRVSEWGFVLEFGPGYGSVTRLLFNLGFQGRVVLFDLPAFSALQRFYLDGLGIKACDSVEGFIAGEASVICLSDFDELCQILDVAKPIEHSLFIGTWSMSEAPRDIRDAVLSLARDFDGFLMSFQREFGETDNLSFFGSWKEDHKDIDWQMWEIEHLPGNYYLMGLRKEGR